MSLYNTYRPQTFQDVIGQDHITSILQEQHKQNTFAHAYLLVGPRGTGKTTTARLIAKALNNLDESFDVATQNYIDIIEIDAASNTGVDDMRDLIDKARFAPTAGQNKVYIIDEVHMLSKAAFNALLKTLEEPPSHAYFVLATTEVHKVPVTIASRTMRFDFHRISEKDIITRLEMIADKENISTDTAALQIIARESDGGLRDAINIFDQTILENKLTKEHVIKSLGLVGMQSIELLVKYLFAGDTKDALALINRLYQEGIRLEQLIQNILKVLKTIVFDAVEQKSLDNDSLQRYIAISQYLITKEFKTQGNRLFEVELWVLEIGNKVKISDHRSVSEEEKREKGSEEGEEEKKKKRLEHNENKNNPNIVKDALDIFGSN